jgi:hypothetical protein
VSRLAVPKAETRRKDYTKSCERCGEDFRPWSTLTRFCSKRCAASGSRPERRTRKKVTCAHCGKEFELSQGRLARNARYCSRACWREGYVPSEQTRQVVAQKMRARKGKANPNYKHGGRAGARSRDGERRFLDEHRGCRNPDCDRGVQQIDQHHAVYRQEVVRMGGDPWDQRDALALCKRCHSGHHSRGSVLPLAVLRDENFIFAAELLGGPVAYEYLRRRYSGDDPRLAALLAA